jgi:hypothetical protein
MISGSNTRLRLIFAKSETPRIVSGPLPGAPPGDESARKHRIREIDGDRAVDDTAQA